MIEVLTTAGRRYSYPADKYKWMHGLVNGTRDVEDLSVVEIYRLPTDEDAEAEFVLRINNVEAVGSLHGNQTFLFAEKRVGYCDNCGSRKLL